MKDRHQICAACGKSFVKSTRRGVATCSPDCGKAVQHKVKACVPACRKEDEGYREITFSSGRIGGQKFCHKCKQTKIVARRALN